MTLEGAPVHTSFPELPHGPRLLQFKAYVKSGRLNVAGEIVLQIAIPYEDKYRALPLTDIRGVMFVVDVHGLDAGDDDTYKEIDRILDTVPDENPTTTNSRDRRNTEKANHPSNVTHKLRLVQYLDFDPFTMEEGEDGTGD